MMNLSAPRESRRGQLYNPPPKKNITLNREEYKKYMKTLYGAF
jgi:hypothetical protein